MTKRGANLGTAQSFGNGIPFRIWILLWALGVVVPTVLIALDFMLPSIDRLVGRDFTNLWVAGRLVSAGTPGCAYDVNCFRLAIYHDLSMLSVQNYSYPPTALFLAWPFSVLPYYVALGIWTCAGAAFFLWCAKPLLRGGFPLWLAALTPAAALNIWSGQFGFITGGLWLLYFRFLEKRPTLSGICAALLTFKPHLGLMIAATVVRNRRALITALLATLILILLSAAAFGAPLWFDFLFVTSGEQQEILTRSASTFYFKMMPSAYVDFGKGLPGVSAQVINITLACMLLIRHRRWDAFAAATATFVLLPYAFNYDMTVACLGFIVALYARWTKLLWWERCLLILAFLSPELTYFFPILVPPSLVGALWIQLRNPDLKANVAADDGTPVSRSAFTISQVRAG